MTNLAKRIASEKRKAKIIKGRMAVIFDKVANLLEFQYMDLTTEEIKLFTEFNIELAKVLTQGNRRFD